MSYGLQVWSTYREWDQYVTKLTFDSSSRYCRLLYSDIVTANGSLSSGYMTGHQTIQWGEALVDSYDPIVYRSGDMVYWTLRTLNPALILIYLFT